MFLAEIGRKAAQAGLPGPQKLTRAIGVLASGSLFRKSYLGGQPNGKGMIADGIKRDNINQQHFLAMVSHVLNARR